MERKFNILVINVPFHEGMAGTKRVRNLMAPLYEENLISISNLVLTTTSQKDRIGEQGTNNGIDYKYVGYSSVKNISSVLKFYRDAKSFIRGHLHPEEKNIIYYYGYPDLKNLLFILYARRKKYKIIFDIVEDNRHYKHFLGITGKVRNMTAIYLLKKVPSFGDAIIAISRPLEDWMNEIVANKIKVYNIPITVDTKSFEGAEMRDSKSNEVNIFYGGSFAPKDGLEYLLTAFNDICKKYDGVRLILTGVGLPADMEKLHEAMKVNPKIDYRGFLSTAEYYNVLRNSDICCMTRNNSLFANAGFPFKLGEFLAAGKAIIATNVGDVPIYLTDGVNALLIPPESVDAIAEALSRCIENKGGIRQQLGVAAKKTAKTYFDDSILSKKLLEIFKEV